MYTIKDLQTALFQRMENSTEAERQNRRQMRDTLFMLARELVGAVPGSIDGYILMLIDEYCGD